MSHDTRCKCGHLDKEHMELGCAPYIINVHERCHCLKLQAVAQPSTPPAQPALTPHDIAIRRNEAPDYSAEPVQTGEAKPAQPEWMDDNILICERHSITFTEEQDECFVCTNRAPYEFESAEEWSERVGLTESRNHGRRTMIKFAGWAWIVGLVVGTVVAIIRFHEWKSALLAFELAVFFGGIIVITSLAITAICADKDKAVTERGRTE